MLGSLSVIIAFHYNNNMTKNRVILIGGIHLNHKPTCGETMKNQLFLKRFGELGYKVWAVDTYDWKKRPWCLLNLFFVLFFFRSSPFVISASRSSRYLIKFLYYFPLNKNVIFWVVGGNLSSAIKAGRFKPEELRRLKRIIVQGKSMVRELEDLQIHNSIYIPNSKPIIYHPSYEKRTSGPVNFVFLSRIHPEKGISEIHEATIILELRGLNDSFSVDFFGKIEPSYKSDFLQLVKSNKYLSYKGYLDLTEASGYKSLAFYDMMLFPTYWQGEGFPGVVIDANISGVPIIATDWNLNTDVIINGKTGIVIPIKNAEALANAMESVIVGNVDLMEMKKKCNNYIQQFNYENVLSPQILSELFQ